MENIQDILKKYWGYHTFRPLQTEIINATLAGKDVLALLPTGGGKSICFQIPALALPGLCLVVTPLIALMKDQVTQLKKRNIPAAAIFSGMSHQEIDLTLDNCIYGNFKFLYLSPERIQTEIFKVRIQKMNINLLAIDEAHCISEWGYDFRPAYLNITTLRDELPNVNIIAVTATAPSAVKKDIQDKLHFKNGIVFQQSFARINLAYQVKKTEDKKNTLLQILSKVVGSTIIYVNRRKKTKLISDVLNNNNLPTTYYHGGLDNLEREAKQNSWMKNEVKVMVATNAFGLGIDKADVRLVIHLDLPASLEAYYQEAGRAGRDGLKAYAVLLYDKQDILELRDNIQKNNLPIEELKKWYQRLANHYQLAVGADNMEAYKVNWENLTQATKSTPQAAYQAIKQLAHAGLLSINEGLEQDSKVLLHLNHQDLYNLPLHLTTYQSILQALLRLYGGELFTDFCNISEIQIAQYLHMQVSQVSEQLNILEKMKLLSYHAKTIEPTITFLYPREEASHVSLNVSILRKKMEQTHQKSEAVIAYVTHQHRCRAQILLEYFDEVSYEPCNCCDLCRSKNSRHQSHTDIKKLILEKLNTSAHYPTELIQSIDRPEEMIIYTIRKLLDQGLITYDINQRLMKQ